MKILEISRHNSVLARDSRVWVWREEDYWTNYHDTCGDPSLRSGQYQETVLCPHHTEPCGLWATWRRLDTDVVEETPLRSLQPQDSGLVCSVSQLDHTATLTGGRSRLSSLTSPVCTLHMELQALVFLPHEHSNLLFN